MSTPETSQPSEAELLVRSLSRRVGDLTAERDLLQIRLDTANVELTQLRGGTA